MCYFALWIASFVVYQCIDGKDSKRYKITCENSNIITIRDGIDNIFKKNDASIDIVIDNVDFSYTKELEVLDGYLIVIDLEKQQVYDIAVHSNSISYSKEEKKFEDISLFKDRMKWYRFETILDRLDSLDYSDSMEYANIITISSKVAPFAFNSCKYYYMKDSKIDLLDKTDNKNLSMNFDFGVYLSEFKSSRVNSYTSTNGLMILFEDNDY